VNPSALIALSESVKGALITGPSIGVLPFSSSSTRWNPRKQSVSKEEREKQNKPFKHIGGALMLTPKCF